jgi:hypothetical protein
MEPWIVPVLTVGASFLGGLFGGYISKRGEIHAVHKELDKVVAQTTAITKATEEIKDTLLTKAWARDIRKEVSFEAIKTMGKLNDRVTDFMVSHRMKDGEFLTDTLRRRKAANDFDAIHDDLLGIQMLVAVVCSNDVSEAIGELLKHSLDLAMDLSKGRLGEDEAQVKRGKEFGVLRVHVGEMVRKDLGIDN